MAEIEGDVGGQRGRRGRVHPSKARRTAGESREEKSSGRSPHGELTYRHFAMESLSFLSSPYTYGLAAAGSGAGDVRLLTSSGATYGLAAAGSGVGDVQLLARRVTHG
jgi:hypothetical protein